MTTRRMVEEEIEMRVRWRLLGGHVHLRVFVGRRGYTGGLAGTLIVRQEEWPDIRDILLVGGAALIEEEVDPHGT